MKAIVGRRSEFFDRLCRYDEVDHLEEPLDQIIGQTLRLAGLDEPAKRLALDALDFHEWKVSLYMGVVNRWKIASPAYFRRRLPSAIFFKVAAMRI